MLNKKFLILVVDDHEDTVNLIKRSLQRYPVEVLSATSAIDAIGLLTNQVDLILTDFDMPNMNGTDLCHIAKKKFHIPVVLMTGLQQLYIGKNIDGFDAILSKPFRGKHLFGVLNEQLHYRLRYL